jgi:Kef-type K+ transport system membrane component KefB
LVTLAYACVTVALLAILFQGFHKLPATTLNGSRSPLLFASSSSSAADAAVGGGFEQHTTGQRRLLRRRQKQQPAAATVSSVAADDDASSTSAATSESATEVTPVAATATKHDSQLDDENGSGSRATDGGATNAAASAASVSTTTSSTRSTGEAGAAAVNSALAVEPEMTGVDKYDHHVQHLKPSEVGHNDQLELPNFFYTLQLMLVCLASRQIGVWFETFGLPVISGFLLGGMLAGPHLLGLLTLHATQSLRVVDQISIAGICLLAGSELYVPALKRHARNILIIMVSMMSATFAFTFATVFAISDYIPFEADMTSGGRLAVALLVGTVLMARSPASAIAVVRSLNANGPFVNISVSVAILADLAIIVLFSLNVEIASSLIRGDEFKMASLLLPFGKLVVSGIAGFVLALHVDFTLTFFQARQWKRPIAPYILAMGLLPFSFSAAMPALSIMRLEPLLTCVVTGTCMQNRGVQRVEFAHHLEALLPFINLVFFTSAGAELALNTLLDYHSIVVGGALFIIRLIALYAGSRGGGYLSARPAAENKVAWMGYITQVGSITRSRSDNHYYLLLLPNTHSLTLDSAPLSFLTLRSQAGVGMGLARDVAIEFPSWGPAFASMMISVMVLNQVVGPPLFKYAIVKLGEAGRKGTETGKENDRETGKLLPTSVGVTSAVRLDATAKPL